MTYQITKVWQTFVISRGYQQKLPQLMIFIWLLQQLGYATLSTFIQVKEKQPWERL